MCYSIILKLFFPGNNEVGSITNRINWIQQVEVTNTMKCAFLISLVMGSMVASAQADICDCAGPAVRTNRAFNNKK